MLLSSFEQSQENFSYKKVICLCWYKRKFISQNLWNDSLSNSNVLNFHIANTRHLCWLYYETWPVWWQACTCCVMKPDLFYDRPAPVVLWSLTCLMTGLHLLCYETWPVWWQACTCCVMKPDLFDDRTAPDVLWNLTCLMKGLHLMCYETWPVWWQDFTWRVLKPDLFDDRTTPVVLWNLTCFMTGLHLLCFETLSLMTGLHLMCYETWPVLWQAYTWCVLKPWVGWLDYTWCVMKPDQFDYWTTPDVLWNLTCLMTGLHLKCYETWPVWWQEFTCCVMKPDLFDDRAALFPSHVLAVVFVSRPNLWKQCSAARR